MEMIFKSMHERAKRFMGLKVHEDDVKHVKSLENESTINLKGQIFIAPQR